MRTILSEQENFKKLMIDIDNIGKKNAREVVINELRQLKTDCQNLVNLNMLLSAANPKNIPQLVNKTVIRDTNNFKNLKESFKPSFDYTLHLRDALSKVGKYTKERKLDVNVQLPILTAISVGVNFVVTELEPSTNVVNLLNLVENLCSQETLSMADR